MLGAIKNGGLGTATTFLGLALADRGHDVELLHFGHNRKVDDTWAQRYREARITVTQLPRPSIQVAPHYHWNSYAIYEYLRERRYDAIVFQDWHAPGFCSMRAKQLGLAFDQTTLVHYCHGPTAWLFEANGRFVRSVDELASNTMERASAELADVVVSPSDYLLGWMRAAGWRVPLRSFVIPLFSASTFRSGGDAAVVATETPNAPPEEIVFFGRLEDRKGIAVFVEALNRLDAEVLRGRRVTFLGREDTWSAGRVRKHLKPSVRKTVVGGVEFHTGLDQVQALERLSRHGTLAVMPSLTDNSPCVIYECMEQRVSFITSNTGGGPELIRTQDRDHVLFPPTPDGLAETLESILRSDRSPPRARPSFGADDLHARWDDVFQPVADYSEPARTEATLVSVIVTHYERPELVGHCLDGLRRQTYANLEVILVDDGSSSDGARQALASLERDTWPWPFRVIRQENRYLGAARNAGWRAARGELVAFLDDDDVPYDSFVERLARAQRASGADVVTCGMRFFHCDDGPPKPDREDVAWFYMGEPRELGVIQNQYGGACSLWKTDLLERLGGGFHEQHGVTYEDWELFARASLAGITIVSVPEPLMWYRITEGSMIRSKREYECRRVLSDTFGAALPETLRLLPSLVHLAYNDPVTQRELHRASLGSGVRGYLAHGRILTRRSIEVAQSDGLAAVGRKGVAWVRRRGGPAHTG